MVWHIHHVLGIEMVQKTAIRSIFPNHNYEEALQKTKLPTLAAKREQLFRDHLAKCELKAPPPGLLPNTRHVPSKNYERHSSVKGPHRLVWELFYSMCFFFTQRL